MDTPGLQHLPAPARWRDTIVVAGVLTVAYLLLLTRDWTPGGDSEFLTVVARSLVRGEGYTYNGQPVRLVPPGWPWLLAGVFKLSPTFLAGKIVNIVCMVVGAALSHRVLLRLVPPRLAMICALLSAMLATAYPLTTWLHSDPLFIVVAWLTTLAAIRVVEARQIGTGIGWLAAMLLAAAWMPVVRYAGVFQWGIALAVLLSVLLPWRRSSPGRWAALGAVVLGTVVAVGMLAYMLTSLGGSEPPAVAVASTTTVPAEGANLTDSEHELPGILDNGPASRPHFVVDRTMRLLGSGQWPAWLIWYPARFASGVPGGGIVITLVGFACMALIALAALDSLRARRQAATFPLTHWIWLSLLIYILLIAFIWPLPNARYLVPIAPLILAGVVQGCGSLSERLDRPRLGRALAGAFFGSIVAINGLLYAIDVYIQRFTDRYEVYEAGRLGSLVDAVDYLKSAEIGHNELVVSERYDNLGRMRFLKSGTREVVLLLDRDVLTMPDVYSFEPGEPGEPGAIPQKSFDNHLVLPGGIAQWAKKHGVRYYLFQRPAYPWRLWHFRLPVELHHALGGADDTGMANGWVLYSIENGWREPISVPQSDERITRVPGL